MGACKRDGYTCDTLVHVVQYFNYLSSVVNGRYSNWTLSIPCNASCGDGVEVWRRTCSNPEPKYNGRNCSGLGISTEFRNCSRTPCPSKASQHLQIYWLKLTVA